MIFKPITDSATGATKSISIFNSSLSTMKENLKNGHGPIYSIFGGNQLRKADVEALNNYVNGIKSGLTPAQSWTENLSGSSVAAKQYILNAKKAGKTTNELAENISNMSNVSIPGQMALKGLSMAGNMLSSMAISFAINTITEGIQYLASSNERYLESQQQIVDKTNEQIAEYDAEIDSLTNLQERLVEAKGNKEKLIEVQNDLNAAIGETPNLLNGEDDAWSVANQKITDRIALLQRLRENELADNIQSTKNIYNNKEVDNDWGTNRKLSEYFNLEYYSLINPNETAKTYDELYKEYVSKIGTDNKQSFAEILADYAQENLHEGALEHLPNAQEIQTYLDEQYSLISPLFSDYISNLNTILPKEAINDLLKQFVYLNPDDAEAVEEQFKTFIDNLQNNDLEQVYNDYLKSLNDDTLDSKELYDKLQNIINSITKDFPAAKQILDEFLNTAGTVPDGLKYNLITFGFDIASDSKTKSFSFVDALQNSEDYFDYIEKFQTLTEAGNLSPDVLSSTEEYSNLLQTLGYSADDAVFSLKKFFGVLDYGNMMDGLESTLSPIIDAQLELAKNGKLSFDTTKSLLDLQPDFIDQMNVVEGGYVTTNDALQNLINTKLQSFEIDNNKFVDSANAVITSLGGEAIAYGLTTDEIIKQIKAKISLLQTKQVLKQMSDAVNDAISLTNAFLGKDNIIPYNIIHNDATSIGFDLIDNKGFYSDDINKLNSILDQIEAAKINNENVKEIIEALKQKITDKSNGSSVSDSNKDSLQTYDWIEIKINRLNDALDRIKTKAGNVYSSWTKRNTELANAISKTKEAIDLQSLAYNKYMQEADSVGLPEEYKQLVQSGAIDINTPISDETLKTQISDYRTWYEKAQECLKTQDDLNAELNELNTQKFDNIKSEYDDIINRMQSAYDLIENQITLLSSSEDYDTLRNKQVDIVNNLQAERNALQNNLNSSDVQQYTEEWYNLISQINDLDSQILDAENKLKDIDNLQFDNLKEAFDFDTSVSEHGLQTIQNKIDLLELKGQFANESYYNGMIEYTQQQLDTLKNERTQLQGILNNTLYKQGTSEWNNMYSTLMDIDEEIDSMTNNVTEYNNAIRDLNWEIFEYLEEALNRITDETDYLVELLSKKDLFDENGQITNYGTTSMALHAAAYDVYKQQAQDYYEEVQDLQKQLVNGAGEEVLAQYNDMVKAHQDAVLAAEDEKQAILDLIEDGYNAQLDALQRLIDKKKEQLNAEKNLYDYQKSIAEKADNISSLEKQKLAYEGDTSEEAMSKIQQIKVQLEEAKADLKESEYEQYLSDTETMLDQLAEDYETWMNERLDHSDELIAQVIGKIALQSDTIKATLKETSDYYGTFISDSLNTIFNSDSPFTQSLTGGMNNVANSLNSGLGGVSTSIAGTTTAINNLVSQVANLVNVETSKTNADSNVAVNNNGTNNTDSSNNSSNVTSGNTVVNKPSTDISNTKKNTTTTGNRPTSNTTSSSTSSSSNTAKTGKSLLDSILINKKDYYPKGSLNIDTSVVDRLKYNDKDSSFSARAKYWSKIFGGTYTGSPSQNTKLLNYLKSNGYKSGTSNAVKGNHWTQEDGGEIIYRTSDGAVLTPLGQGDMVFDNESSKRLWELANNPEAFIKKYNISSSIISAMVPQHILNSALPDFCSAEKSYSSQNMSVGDINVNMELPNVSDYKDFRNQLIGDSTFEKAMFTSINHALTGKGTPLDKLKHSR